MHQVVFLLGQVFRRSGIQVFRYSGVQVFRYSGIQVFRVDKDRLGFDLPVLNT
jgi:hypothetical protein